MSENHFDNYFKNQLQSYSSPVPKDMFERIVATANKKRPIAAWFNKYGFLAGLLIIGTIAAIVLVNNNTATKIEKVAATNTIKNNEQQAVENPSVSINTINSENNKTTAERSATENSLLSSANTASEKNSAVSQNQLRVIDNIKNSDTGLNEIKLSNIKKRSIAGFFNNKNNQSTTTNQLLIAAAINTDDLSEEVRTGLLDFNYPAKTFSMAELWRMERKRNGLAALTYITNRKNPIGDCPSVRGRNRNDWYIEAFGSPDYTFKSLTTTGLNTNFLEKKDSSETMRGGFTGGLRISKNFGENFILKSGIQFSQLNERFSVRKENEKRITTVIRTRTVIRGLGDTIQVRDTSSLTEIGYLNKRRTNFYRNIEMPLIAGYEWGDEYWKFSANIGVIAHAMSWYSGEMLDTTLSVISFSSKEVPNIYKTKIGLSAYVGFSFIKRFNSNTEIFAEPYFRTNLINMNLPVDGLKQRFSAAGINIGIRKKINR